MCEALLLRACILLPNMAEHGTCLEKIIFVVHQSCLNQRILQVNDLLLSCLHNFVGFQVWPCIEISCGTRPIFFDDQFGFVMPLYFV